MIGLHTNPRARGAMVHGTLEELGQPYPPHLMDYGTTLKAHDDLAVPPMGKVPAMRHDDQVTTEIVAIIA